MIHQLMQPEYILLVASILWMSAALATGLPHRRFPSEFPFMFSLVAFVAAMIGVTELVPESVDMMLTAIGVILFSLIPVVVTIKLYQSYPPVEANSHASAT